jgi:putative tryptophan/tyrosine transport system substrate-binding protein
MRRRQFLALSGVVGTWFAVEKSAAAQQRLPIARIALLDPGTPQDFEAFRNAMRDLGYIEGQNVAYDYRSAKDAAKSFRELAVELVQSNPAVIVTASPPAVRAAKEATSTIPIVIAAIGDAVAAGVVSGFAHPGGNVTGLSFLNEELSSKRLQLLVEAVPDRRRIGLLWDPTSLRRWVEVTEQASRSLGVETKVLEISGPDAFVGVFEAAAAARIDALDVLSSAFFNAHKDRIVALAARGRLPAMYEHDDFVRSGGLISYGPSIPDLFRRAATYVDKILKGTKPGDLPVEQPTKFELIVNLKTARELALTIPPSILARADEIIE